MTSLRTLSMGWQILLQKRHQRLFKESARQTQKVGLVIFGSDWGMCGQFNERIADRTQKYLNYPDIVSNAKNSSNCKTFSFFLNSCISIEHYLLLLTSSKILHSKEYLFTYDF